MAEEDPPRVDLAVQDQGDEEQEEGFFSIIKGGLCDAVDEIKDVAGISEREIVRRDKGTPQEGVIPQNRAEVKKLLKQMPLIMRENACTKVVTHESNNPEEAAQKEYKWRSIRKTSPAELGEYGVGIQLYFELLQAMGILYVVLFVISFPTLVMSLMGNYVKDNPSTKDMSGTFLARFTIANLGACTGDICASNPDDRFLCDGCSTKLRDATFWIGLFDGFGTVIFLLFAVAWLHWWIPKRVAKHDEDNVTAGDFAIDVHHLPKVLGGDTDSELHKNYAEELKKHFTSVIKLKHKNIPDEDPIHEVALIREYDGYVRSFINIGYLRKLQVNEETNLRIAQNHNDEKKVKKYTNAVTRIKKTVQEMDDAMGKQGDMEDIKREVCGAVVMFKTERYKDIVLRQYKVSSQGFFGRMRQKEALRFHKTHISATQACEPSDLYWENLDYGHIHRKMRQCVVLLITILIIIVTLAFLINLRSYKVSAAKSRDPVTTYVLSPANSTGWGSAGCIDACSWALFEDPRCRVPRNGLRGDWETSTGEQIADELGLPFTACSMNPFIRSSSSCHPYIVYTSRGTPPGGTPPRDIPGVKADCLKLKLRTTSSSSENAASSVALYECPAWDAANPNLETQCTRLRDPFPNLADDTVSQARIEMDKLCENPVPLAAAEAAKQRAKDAGKAIGGDLTVSCFCQRKQAEYGMFDMSSWLEAESAVCTEYFENGFNSLLIKGLSIVSVCVLNFTLNIVFFYMDQWTRHRTMTGLTMSSMTKLFYALFINTGLIYLAVSADLHVRLNFLGPLKKIGQGPFSDLTGGWYVASGTDFFLTMAANIFVFAGCPLATSFIANPFLIRVFRRGLVTESMLREVYVLPEWPLSLRLAQALTTFFCVAMYSGGMPLLYLIGAAYCLVSYWADKACLLRGSQVPPTYNEDLVEEAVKWIFAAGFLHVAVTSWMFGLQELFPSDFSGLQGLFEGLMDMPLSTYNQIMADWLANYEPGKYDKFPDYVHARLLDMSRQGCIVVALLLLVFVGHILIYEIAWIMIVRPFVLGRLTRDVDKMEEQAIEQLQDTMNNAQRTINTVMERAASAGKEDAELARGDSTGSIDMALKRHKHKVHKVFSYKMEANPKYAGAYEALKFCEHNDEEMEKQQLEEGKTLEKTPDTSDTAKNDVTTASV